jgi:monofunctional biosynthetic peptidoglycan transglycosylase
MGHCRLAQMLDIEVWRRAFPARGEISEMPRANMGKKPRSVARKRSLISALRKRWRKSSFRKRMGDRPRRVATVAIFVALWPLLMTLVYGIFPPPASNLMILRLFSGNSLAYHWVRLDRISPYLPLAVVSSEDARFCAHNGVDWIEFSDVLEEATDGDGEGPIRGASTISMQTAKNLFLWEGRNPIRKVLELPLAYWMDFWWTKRRMIEVYLNIVEWAPGIYGAEAAAQYHFRKSAAKLTKREAALLAAVLPNPIARSAGRPSKRVSRTAGRIMTRMNIMGPYVTCLGLGSPL